MTIPGWISMSAPAQGHRHQRPQLTRRSFLDQGYLLGSEIWPWAVLQLLPVELTEITYGWAQAGQLARRCSP